MPALKPVPAVARVTCRGIANGQSIVNVFHVKRVGGNMSSAAVTAIGQGVKTAYETNFAPRLATTWVGDTVRVVDLSLLAGQEYTVALNGTPTLTATSTPQSAAICVTWKILKHYRGGHPRTYLGPIGQTAFESATTLAAAYVTQVQGNANAFLTAVNAIVADGGACSLVAVHRWENKEELLIPETSPILSAVCDTRIDTMRRRLGPDR